MNDFPISNLKQPYENSNLHYFKFSSNSLGFLELLLLTTFRPVRSSNSLKAFPAMLPPSLATVLLSSKPCGFSVLLISVVANSPNMLITSSALVMLSRRFSFFNPLIRLCSPVVMPKEASLISLVSIAYSLPFLTPDLPIQQLNPSLFQFLLTFG